MKRRGSVTPAPLPLVLAISAAALGLALPLPAAAQAPAMLRCPATGGQRWIELVSDHFVLRTDVGARAARKALVEFERTHAAFQALAFPSLSPPRGRIDVVLFAREQDFRAIAPSGAAGYFMPRQMGEAERAATVVLHGELDLLSRRRFQHELAHRFLGAHLREPPPWIEEGLAEYYSTMRLEWGEAVFGELALEYLFAADNKVQGCLIRRTVDNRVALEDVPPLADLLAADQATFHAPARERAHYAASWAFVHMLNHHEIYRARLLRYLNALAGGSDADDAWRLHFGDLDLGALDREFRAYIVRPVQAGVDKRYQRYESPTPRMGREARPMGDGELHLLWARVRPWDARESILRAGDDLRQAATSDPGDPELLYWMSLYHRRWRRWDLAEEDLRRALAVRPDDERLLHALGAVYSEREREREAPDPRDEEALAELVERLAARARSAPALNFVARYLAERGAPEAGLPFARRAVLVGPDCWECRDTFTALASARTPGVVITPSITLPPPPPAPVRRAVMLPLDELRASR